MCKPGKSVNTEIKSYSFLHENALQKPAVGGAPPRTDALIGPAVCGRCLNSDSLKRRASARALLSSLLQLSGAPELVTTRSNARKADLEAGPLDSHNETNQRSLRLCQSRNGATNSTIAEESFPDDVTQREPAEFPEQRAELTT